MMRVSSQTGRHKLKAMQRTASQMTGQNGLAVAKRRPTPAQSLVVLGSLSVGTMVTGSLLWVWYRGPITLPGRAAAGLIKLHGKWLGLGELSLILGMVIAIGLLLTLAFWHRASRAKWLALAWIACSIFAGAYASTLPNPPQFERTGPGTAGDAADLRWPLLGLGLQLACAAVAAALLGAHSLRSRRTRTGTVQLAAAIVVATPVAPLVSRGIDWIPYF